MKGSTIKELKEKKMSGSSKKQELKIKSTPKIGQKIKVKGMKCKVTAIKGDVCSLISEDFKHAFSCHVSDLS